MGDRKMEGKQDETLGMETCHRLASQPGKDTIILLVASSQENWDKVPQMTHLAWLLALLFFPKFSCQWLLVRVILKTTTVSMVVIF